MMVSCSGFSFFFFFHTTWHTGSYSPTRDQIHALCIGKAVLTNELLGESLNVSLKSINLLKKLEK